MTPAASITALSVPLSKSAPNFAPAKPIQDAIQNKKLNKNPSRFEQAFREWYTAKMNHEKAAWDEMVSMAQLVALFRKGNQLLQRRRYGPGWYVRPVQNEDTTRQTALSFMGFHSQVCESKIMAANPTVNMRAGDDTPEAIAAAQACRPVVDFYESEWYTAKFSRREAIRFLTDGIVIHQVRWNPFLGGYHVADRTVTHEDVTTEGGGECLDCNHEGSAEDFNGQYGAECPECRSPAVDVRQPIHQQLARIGMGQPQPMGEPEIISSPFAAWRWDLSLDLELSPWAIKRQYITHGAIKLMLGDVSIPDSPSSDQWGLDVIRALTYSGQAFAGSSAAEGRRQESTRPTLAECWLSPEEQAMIEVDEGETIAGVTMPKGRLSDFFKGDWCCVAALNDGALVAGLYGRESHQTEVVTAQWFMDAESGGGRGMEDTAAVQRRFNQVDGQIYQGLATTATPSVITDMSILKEDQGRYLFRPGENIDVSLAMLPPNTTLKDAFFIGNPGQINPQYIQYGYTYLNQMAQVSSLITEMSLGNNGSLVGVDNRTATGAQITAALANSLFGPMLQSKGQSRVEIAKKIVALVAKHDVGGRYYPGKGAAKGRMIDPNSLKGRVVFELVANSELPVTPFSQQTDVRAMVESLGGIEGVMALKQGDPPMFYQLAKPFNFKSDSESEDDVSNLCLGRLEQMKSNLQAGVNDPQMLVEMIRPTVRQTEPKHDEKARWWSDWQDLQSAQEAPEELRQAAENMFWLHKNLATQRQIPEAVNKGLVQAAAQAPAAMGAAALQPQEQGQQDGSQQIDSDERMQDQEHDHEMELKDKESESQARVARIQQEGQLASTALQGKQQLELEKVKGQNAVRTARAKPKPVARKTA